MATRQLQGATQDTSIKDTILNFQASYLKAMHAADQAAGRRLVDVLDMHWYPEAQDSNGVRITDGTTAASAMARVQAPRSLWDPTYVEKSWITQDSLPFQPAMTPAKFKGDAIQLLPREQAIVNEYDPGAKISISEYNYGGGSDISGAIAEADVLGIFGQQGVFSANEWPLQSSEPYIAAGMNMFRNYDGANSTFGDTSISAIHRRCRRQLDLCQHRFGPSGRHHARGHQQERQLDRFGDQSKGAAAAWRSRVSIG